MSDQRPVLLCDVDGVISLWGFDHSTPPPGFWVQVDGSAHYMSEEAAEQLRALTPEPFELVWCTGWEERAEEHLPGLLDLPPGNSFLRFDGRSRAEVSAHGHWKLPAIDRFCRGRVAVWIDDALDEACRAWAAARPEPTLLVPTDPASGLTAAHAADVQAFGAAMLGL